MNSRKSFPVRVEPFPGESLEAFGLRVAYRNGRESLLDLCNAMSLTAKLNNRKDEIKDPQRFSGRLSQFLQIDAELLERTTKTIPLGFEYDENRYIQDIRSSHHKICTPCLLDGNPIEKSWSYVHITHCEKHGSRLIDHCPSCNKHIKFHADIFELCPSCGMRWGEVPQEKKGIPAYQNLLNSISRSKAKAVFRIFYDTALICSRPGDLMFRPVHKLNLTNDECIAVLSTTFAILTSQEYADGWLNWVSSLRPEVTCTALFRDKQLADFLTGAGQDLRKTLKTPAGVEFSKDYFEGTESTISSPRRKLSTSNNDFKYQMGYIEAQQTLGLESGALARLVEYGVIQPLNSTRTLKDFIFDARDLQNYIFKVLFHRSSLLDLNALDSTELLSVGKARSKLGLFAASDAELIQVLLSEEETRIYRASDRCDNWSDFFVKKKELYFALNKNLKARLADVLKTSEFVSMMAAKTREANTLISGTSVNFTFNSCNGTRLCAESVRNFLEQYLVLNRICDFFDVSAPDAKKLLQGGLGLKPVKEVLAFNEYYFYESSQENLVVDQLAWLVKLSSEIAEIIQTDSL